MWQLDTTRYDLVDHLANAAKSLVPTMDASPPQSRELAAETAISEELFDASDVSAESLESGIRSGTMGRADSVTYHRSHIYCLHSHEVPVSHNSFRSSLHPRRITTGQSIQYQSISNRQWSFNHGVPCLAKAFCYSSISSAQSP